MTSSGDPPQQVVGRTGYDFLASSKLFTFSLFAFIACIVLIIFYPDSFVSSVNYLIDTVSANISYLIPIILGFLCGRYIFRRWIRKDIVILVEPMRSPSYCVRMSDTAFSRYTKKNGMLNPEPTVSGSVMYRAKSIDFEKEEIDGGWIHEKKTSPSVVFTRKSKYYDFLEDYRKAKERVLELTDTPFVEGTEYGLKFVNKNIELQEAIIFGEPDDDHHSDTEHEGTESEHEVTEEVHSDVR